MHWRATTAEETEALGAALARTLPTTAALVVVYLKGGLGAGKTTLARGFLREHGVSGSVRSPTYTLVESYDSGSPIILHLDLYRLRDASEFEPLGLRDWAGPGYLWLVEWPERADGMLPPADLVIELKPGDGNHEITAHAHSDAGKSWLARLTEVETPRDPP